MLRLTRRIFVKHRSVYFLSKTSWQIQRTCHQTSCTPDQTRYGFTRRTSDAWPEEDLAVLPGHLRPSGSSTTLRVRNTRPNPPPKDLYVTSQTRIPREYRFPRIGLFCIPHVHENHHSLNTEATIAHIGYRRGRRDRLHIIRQSTRTT